jgi:hypothetical protein
MPVNPKYTKKSQVSQKWWYNPQSKVYPKSDPPVFECLAFWHKYDAKPSPKRTWLGSHFEACEFEKQFKQFIVTDDIR